MALWPWSLLCSWSHQVLVIRPAFAGSSPAQSLLRTSRCTRSRIIRCTVASSDLFNRKSRRMVYPKIKVNAFRGYAPKVTIQSSTERSEHHDCDEETIGTFNGQLSAMDVAKSTSGRDAETTKEDLPHNASSFSASRQINVAEKVGLDLFETEFPGNALINISLGEVEAVDETAAEENKFEMDFSGIALSSAAVWELDSKEEAKVKEDIFVVDLSRIAPDCAAVGEVVDEEAIQETFDVGSSGNASSNGTYGDVDEVGEPLADQEVTFEMNMSILGKLNAADHAKVENNTFEVQILSSASGNEAMYMAVESSEEKIAMGDNEQWQCPALPSTSMKDSAINETPENSKHEPIPPVRVQDQDKLVFDIDEEEGSIIDSCEEDQPEVDHKQGGNAASFDKQKQLTSSGFSEQDLSIVQCAEKNHAIVDSPKDDPDFLEKEQAIVCCNKQDQPIFNLHEQDQSVGSHSQDESIVGVPEQIQSIIAHSTPNQFVVGLPKHHRLMVHTPEQKRSVVGFHVQDLSIADNSKESQTMELAIVQTNDALLTERVEAKDGDCTSQETDGDTLQAKFGVDKLLHRYKEGLTEEAALMTTSMKNNEEHFEMIKEPKSISVGKEKCIVTEEGISMSEAESLLFSEKENSWAEYEVGITEDEKQNEVDEKSMFAEQDIQEVPQDDVDPQTLQRMLQELAEKNYSLGSKLFVFPEVLKADSTIDLYFNRNLSTLANEPDILIKGAFNGWKWKFFTEKLQMSEQGGDWWCCKLYIPKQAYRLDFVFFNGRTVYENNGDNDFMIQIKSTMDEHLFEDFLVQEKQRELERLAIEEAERRREAEEQRRREEERASDEADKAQAKAEVEMKKNKLRNVLGLARPSIDNLWYIEPVVIRQGAAVRLYYNRNLRPLVHSTEIWIHGGYNNWIDGLSFSERLVPLDDKDGDWWYADVVLPERTFVLDWVFADGPPGNARNYDNNARYDFHAILLSNMTEEEYWVEEEEFIYTRLQRERRERKETIKRKAERAAEMKDEMKKKTMKMFLVSQKHIVYTEPLEIHAGTTVDVLYNPSNTVLTGKPEVWFRCSFNRWMHPGGVLPPQKMVKSENGAHLKAKVNVPRDAYTMDFVFSELEEGGIYDNRNELDYHIPVFGSIAKEPPIHIVHIAVEMAPIAKVGGLADVVTSLSRAVQDLGHNVEVILPKHDCLNLSNVKSLHVHQTFSFGGSEIKVWRGLVEDLCVYFLEPQNGIFGVGCVYGRNDDRRFGFFCHSALEFLLQSGSSPHILHCHDWSSAPVAWLYKEYYARSSLASARVVFTIHNLEFGAHYIGKAMRYCDKATTVSNTYSREVSGHGAIAPHLGKFYGILNGIDPDIWDPYSDHFIPLHYTSENVVEGKSAAKAALQQKLGLQQNDVPIVGIVTRLTAQKGIHLIKHAIHRTLERNGQVVLLGSAPDPRIQSDFINFANTHLGVSYGRVRMCLTYDEPLSHLIYAGSDFILVPSIFEPCGLTQLVAMRYGTIPVVRKTGGLYDTVFDVDNDKERARARGLEPNGFSFDGADSRGVDYALNRAISAWFEARSWFHSLCKRVMEQDWSWNRPALDYIELYHSASKL